MELVADRFWVGDRGDVIDLATGERVELVVSTAGGPSDLVRWSERCAQFSRRRHRVIAPLVDYGAWGEVKRFEAWRSDGVWRGPVDEAARVSLLIDQILERSRRTHGSAEESRMRIVGGSIVGIPSADDGYEQPAELPAAPESTALTLPLEALGVERLGQRAVEIVGESFADDRGARPRALALWGVQGTGLSHAARQLAGAACRHGYVPLSTRVMRPGLLRHLAGRSLCVIARDDPHEAWRLLLEWSAQSPRAHVLVFIGEAAVPGVRAIPLDRYSEDALVASVQPAAWASAHRQAIRRAAAKANGLAGRFAEILWPPAPPVRRAQLTLVRAAETPPAYGDADTPRVVHGHELAALRTGLDEAIADLGRGRHARADRAMRHVSACLARRGDYGAAARGWLELAASLIRRGHNDAAQSALDEARQTASRLEGGGTPFIIRAATLSGIASLHALRFDDSEALLRVAVQAAGALNEPALVVEATIELAQCLFWRARHDEAEHLLINCTPIGAHVVARLSAVRSRVAVGRGDLTTAVTEASRAVDLAAELEQPALDGFAAVAAAFAHLAVGDTKAVRIDVARALAAARAAHDRGLALEARLLLVEAERREGNRQPALILTRRLKRIAPSSLPALLRAHGGLVAELLTTSDPQLTVERAIRASGSPALQLFAPPFPSGRGSTTDLVEILQVCQVADDAGRVLQALSARARQRLRAAAVGFFAVDRGAWTLVASDGSRLDASLATRVHDAGQPIAPHIVRGAGEGGAPIGYGGQTIGVLAARWTVGECAERADACPYLEAVAAAAAPALAELAARRLAVSDSVPHDILGISRAIDDVRRVIERAAAAPFAILIEGESGTGKELVARALHRRGPRRDRMCCTLNCAAIPDELIESELFGHARGAFTGALADKTGVFEEAHLGTLFLDEVGELSPRAQAKLLRTIQEGEIRRVGENANRRVDVRLIAATNRDLRAEVRGGRFRMDLLYRLDVIRVAIPPLRDRRDDIPLLAEHYWRDAAGRVSSRATLGAPVLAALARYDWPGNVRELQNVLFALAVRCPRRGVVPVSALPTSLEAAHDTPTWRLDAARRHFESRFVRAALVRTGGHKARAAEELGVTRQGLAKLITRLGLSADGAGRD